MSQTDFDIEEIGIKDPFKGPNYKVWLEKARSFLGSFRTNAEKDRCARSQSNLNVLRLVTFVQCLLIIGLIGHIGTYFLSMKREIRDFEADIQAIANYKPASEVVLAVPVPHSSLDRDVMRNIFAPYVDSRALAAQAEKQAESAYKEFSRQYSVVGIMMEANPTAIIEERKTGSTYFVGLEDDVRGAIVKDIQTKSVRFSFKGALIDLAL